MAGDVGKGAGSDHPGNRELGAHPLVSLLPEQHRQIAAAVDAALAHEPLNPEQVLRQHLLDRLTEDFASSRKTNANDGNPAAFKIVNRWKLKFFTKTP